MGSMERISNVPTRGADGELEQWTLLEGGALLHSTHCNQGSGFSKKDRGVFHLEGLIPERRATLEQQVQLTFEAYSDITGDLAKYQFLSQLRDRNQTLFFALVEKHLESILPIIYTPVVGMASQKFSRLAHTPSGIYLSYNHRGRIKEVLSHHLTSDIRIIVVTDGERVLGLGDCGIGGMAISVGKLELYTACAGIHPASTLPIVLDVGTDNLDLLNDPLYLGLRHPRVRGKYYQAFVEEFVETLQLLCPDVLLQWEDFGKGNARRLLQRYRERICCFNDDIQGTGAVTLAALMVACQTSGKTLAESDVVILGAGSAATGIADALVLAMLMEGYGLSEAKQKIWLVDSQGLVHTRRQPIETEKLVYAQPWEKISSWASKKPVGLAETVRAVHPAILIGTSAQPKAFSKRIVQEMAQHTSRPIIFPLSNPTAHSEASPKDLLTWTDGRAIVATGSPFPRVKCDAGEFTISQCNNAYLFPGVGLGILASGAVRVTDSMFLAAAKALAQYSLAGSHEGLFPDFSEIREISRTVALAVGMEAMSRGESPNLAAPDLWARIDRLMWRPEYPHLKKAHRDSMDPRNWQ